MIFYYILFYSFILLYGTLKLGIGPDEAKIVFASSGWLHTLANTLYKIYPHELFVRLPVLLISIANVYLIYLLAKRYVKKEQDALLAAVIYSLLPAVLATGVILNKAPFLIFLTALLLLLSPFRIGGMILALVLLFLDKAFAILFLAIAFYALYKKRWRYAFFYFILFCASWLLFGFSVGGKPKSYFLDTFGVFSAIFSPLLFLYFFYVIYRVMIKEYKDVLWFVSAVAFLFALFLSFRQKINLLDFAPFAVFGVILMVRTFLHSVRSRLPKYRKKFYFAFVIVISFMILNDAALFFNELLFGHLKRHFAKQYYIGKLLAKELHQRGISCITTSDTSLSLQLQFYGIGLCSNFKLSKTSGEKINIRYNNRILANYYVSKSNE
ncbi:hypothetical protein NitYY0826_C0756 [Nitratiruptor sp. YY08-26]|uniref:glycosyltransferase family 39 protein n=1 Tax=unclassified Nitratiruptor TaxID=2624044 RepID=UPI001916C10A|nr:MULTISPECIES: glycosyltransferase family 39 protein [unclassified Nitratiruptor]BCD61893.1 hypothetical protein NitYY0813_C0754 [Nitratiruptor sp. YY08-13]BCD65828.1 hypothetical protein NitYY0826_C0756 [Nitratiruptor sp. YY08-26]